MSPPTVGGAEAAPAWVAGWARVYPWTRKRGDVALVGVVSRGGCYVVALWRDRGGGWRPTDATEATASHAGASALRRLTRSIREDVPDIEERTRGAATTPPEVGSDHWWENVDAARAYLRGRA